MGNHKINKMYIKEQSNIEKHRNYMTMFRNDASYSEQYKLFENSFIKIAKGEGQGDLKETIYKMDPIEKKLLDSFMLSRGQGLLFNKCNINPATGKCLIKDPDTGRDIPIGDGLVPQIERFASKYAYSRMTLEVFNTIIRTLNEKASKSTGNKYHFIMNDKAWNDLQITLGDYLAKFHTDGAYMYSKKANGYISVGAAFDSYSMGGNQITFSTDRALTREFGNDKGYMICVDLTADEAKNQPAVAQFSLKGKEFISNSIAGVGGLKGGESGPVATPVAGSKLVIHGYAGISVFNPYRSFIAREL